jgi:hypothetical protein
MGLWAKTALENARAPTKNVIFFILIIVYGLCKDKGDGQQGLVMDVWDKYDNGHKQK